MFDLRLFKRIDWLLAVVMALLIGAGVTVIFIASSGSIAKKQIVWASRDRRLFPI